MACQNCAEDLFRWEVDECAMCRQADIDWMVRVMRWAHWPRIHCTVTLLPKAQHAAD